MYHSEWGTHALGTHGDMGNMGNSCTSVFPITHAWELQEQNTTKKQKKKGASMERSKAGTNKRSPDAYHILTKIQ